MRDTFNVPYDLFPPLLIKLLITFGCYGHQGDIPQVLSAAWAQKNPHRGTSFSPPCLSQSLRQQHTSFIHRVQSPVYTSTSKTTLFLKCYQPVGFQSKLQASKVQGTNGSFHDSPPLHPPPPTFPSVGPPLWLHCRGFCSPSSCLEMRTRHGPLRAFTRYCYVSEPIN